MIRPAPLPSSRRALLRLALAAGASLTWPGRARSQGAPLPAIDALYRLRYEGAQAVELRLRAEAGADGHRSLLTTAAIGFVSLLVDYDGQSEAEGPVRDGRPRPETFASRTVRRGDPRTVDIAFAPGTGDVEALRIVRRGSERESEVPEAMRRGVMDPLTAIQAARAAFLAGDTAPLTLPVFDGRRRYDVTVTVGGRTAVAIAGREVAARELRLAVAMHAGFNEREAGIAGSGGWIHGLVSDDGRALPLVFETRDAPASAAFELVTDCGVEACEPAPAYRLLPGT
ncbi:DUF3108 domain-containing protein [Marinivivus vitaminiproducens]|uniref:DUF3108 domain-containing protein n=1 Tax=Marinivivus vitaminiproducens TaxID=3035935 RepID=UPI0027A0CEC2|nr:DUF3108 domain-containing protein [Geminicoccaceae bacterium SCSIO 64248]